MGSLLLVWVGPRFNGMTAIRARRPGARALWGRRGVAWQHDLAGRVFHTGTRRLRGYRTSENGAEEGPKNLKFFLSNDAA